MKKSVFLLGLLTIAGVCLTACGSKSYNIPFDEALDIAGHLPIQDVLSKTNIIQQDFDIATNVEYNGVNVVANLQTNSKQDNESNKSDSSIKIDANVTYGENENVDVDGNLNIKLIDETLYLNLETLNISGSDNIALGAAMLGGLKNNWFSIPMSGLDDASAGYLEKMNALKAKAKEVINNEGLVVYEGKFTQFSGYNAWKISVNNEKLQEIIDEYYKSINSLEGGELETPQVNVENLEGYLVITGKHKVAIVIDNMDVTNGETVLNINGFGGKDYALTISEEGKQTTTMTANKKGSKYDVLVNVNDLRLLSGTITPKVSKSLISMKFDLILTIRAGEQSDVIIPLKGSWNYKSISDFDVIAPENAQDLTELLGGYLGATIGGDDYIYGEDYNSEMYEESGDSLEPVEVNDSGVASEEASNETSELTVE